MKICICACLSELAQIVGVLCYNGHVCSHTRTAKNTTLHHPSTHSGNDTDRKHNKSHVTSVYVWISLAIVCILFCVAILAQSEGSSFLLELRWSPFNPCVDGIARSMAPTCLKKALSFEATRLASQERVQHSVSSGIQRRTVEQIVDYLAKILLSSWPRPDATNADGTAVARPAGEVRPRGIAKHSTTTEVPSGEAGPFWPRAYDMNSAAATASVKSAGEARPPGFAKQCATTEPELAEGSDEAGPSWSRATDNSAAATAAAKSVGKARPPRIAKQSATTEPELVESCGGAGPSWSRACGNSAAGAAAVKSAGETRSSGIVKYSVTSESGSELADDLELARVALQLRRGVW